MSFPGEVVKTSKGYSERRRSASRKHLCNPHGPGESLLGGRVFRVLRPQMALSTGMFHLKKASFSVSPWETAAKLQSCQREP